MAFLINNLENDRNIEPIQPVLKEVQKHAQVIRDERFMSKPQNTQLENRTQCPASWNKKVEEEIAFAFDRKDIVELVKILSNGEESPLYLKKTRNSPLYIYVCDGANGDNYRVKDKISMIEAAIYMLLQDQETLVRDISQAYKTLLSPRSIYRPQKNIKELFRKRLGIKNSEDNKEEIIHKLREAAKRLGL